VAYDEKLADRIRQAIGPRPDVTEKKMFGGLAFLLSGKMFLGLATADLMVRVGPDGHAAALARPHARPMDFTGRPMKGYVYVAPDGLRSAAALRKWVDLALAFVATVPRRKPSQVKPRRKR
jgi:TfoX/Sxy family transcriptional regulator of competence genes